MLHHLLYLFMVHGNQHSQHRRNYKNQKLGNKVESNTEDPTVQGLKGTEIHLISRIV